MTTNNIFYKTPQISRGGKLIPTHNASLPPKTYRHPGLHLVSVYELVNLFADTGVLNADRVPGVAGRAERQHYPGGDGEKGEARVFFNFFVFLWFLFNTNKTRPENTRRETIQQNVLGII